MQKNPYYEDQSVYEDIELYNKIVPTDGLKPSKKNSSGNTDKINRSISKNQTNVRAKCCLVVVLSLLAVTMVAAIALSVYALVGSNQGMGSLMEEIQELKMQLNKTKEESETEIAKLNRDLTRLKTDGLRLQKSVDMVNTTTITQLSNLQFSVNNIRSSVNYLTTEVNSPVNLYQNCIQETRSCTIGPRTTDTYWTWCQTAYGPVSKAVSLVWAWMCPVLKVIINF